MNRHRHWLTGLVFLALVSCTAQPDELEVLEPESQPVSDVRLEKLLTLMNRRLELMHDVARWKWNEQKPVSDPNREAELLDRLVHQGAEYELPADTLRDFFQAQMDGSKQIQQADFDHWKAEQQLKFENVPDLINDLRPKITELSAQLLASLEELHTEFGQQPFSKLVTEQAKTILTADGITAEVRETVLRPLLSPAAVEPAQ